MLKGKVVPLVPYGTSPLPRALADTGAGPSVVTTGLLENLPKDASVTRDYRGPNPNACGPDGRALTKHRLSARRSPDCRRVTLFLCTAVLVAPGEGRQQGGLACCVWFISNIHSGPRCPVRLSDSTSSFLYSKRRNSW